MTSLRIPAWAVEEMIEHSLASAPAEACGLLAGTTFEGVTRVYALTNREEGDPRVRYVIDAAEQFATMREVEGSGLEMLGAFHSHVRSPARPSETDIGLAGYPEWAWVIISLAGDEPVVRAFSIVDGDVDDVAIEVVR